MESGFRGRAFSTDDLLNEASLPAIGCMIVGYNTRNEWLESGVCRRFNLERGRMRRLIEMPRRTLRSQSDAKRPAQGSYRSMIARVLVTACGRPVTSIAEDNGSTPYWPARNSASGSRRRRLPGFMHYDPDLRPGADPATPRNPAAQLSDVLGRPVTDVSGLDMGKDGVREGLEPRPQVMIPVL